MIFLLILKLLFVELILSNISLFSMNNYTISGRIIDSQTKEGIENVNIFIEKLGVGSSSSSDGYFNIEIESIVSPITLLINHIGFTPKKILLFDFRL